MVEGFITALLGYERWRRAINNIINARLLESGSSLPSERNFTNLVSPLRATLRQVT